MIWHGLVWLVVLILLAFWSLFAWATGALVGWDGWAQMVGSSNPQAAVGQLEAWIASWQLPPAMAAWLGVEWLEPIKAMLGAAAPMVQWLIGLMPGLLSVLTPIVWVMWAIGALVLVTGGVLVSVVIGLARGAGGQIQKSILARAG